MKYPDAYLLTRDIDWFFKLNGKAIHVASAGGKLPQSIKDRNKLREIQYKVSTLKDINTSEEIHKNKKLFESYSNDSLVMDDYLQSFIEMAKKGFISVDRTNIADPNDSKYHIVCIPDKKYFGEELHLEEIVTEDFDINQDTSSFDMAEIFGEDLSFKVKPTSVEYKEAA